MVWRRLAGWAAHCARGPSAAPCARRCEGPGPPPGEPSPPGQPQRWPPLRLPLWRHGPRGRRMPGRAAAACRQRGMCVHCAGWQGAAATAVRTPAASSLGGHSKQQLEPRADPPELEGQQLRLLLLMEQRPVVQPPLVHPVGRQQSGQQSVVPGPTASKLAQLQSRQENQMHGPMARPVLPCPHLTSQRSANLRATMCSSCSTQGAETASASASASTQVVSSMGSRPALGCIPCTPTWQHPWNH